MAVWSIVNFAQLKSDTRIDAEYYQPYFLQFESLLTATGFPVVNLGYLVKEGYRVVYENTKILDEEFDPKYHVKFLQAADILNSFPAIEQSSIGWVNRSDWNRYPQGRIRHGEILIEVKGKAEKVVMIPDEFPSEILITGTLYKMLIDEEKINRYYVFVYLLSKLGRSFRDRGKTNTLISYVNKDDLYSIPIPIVPKKNHLISNPQVSPSELESRTSEPKTSTSELQNPNKKLGVPSSELQHPSKKLGVPSSKAQPSSKKLGVPSSKA
ncbi:hypothetical protein [Nostoc sp.]|uniref:hypothetical protein n=1 Tax=Nostoc sp. TaxID=1180 RepID=UPI002FFCBD95